MMSLDPGNTISLSLSPVLQRNDRSYHFLLRISFRGRRHLLVSGSRCARMLCFWTSKAKERSCATRALLLRVPEVRLQALLWVLQKGRMVSRVPGNWFPVPDLSDTRVSSRGYIPNISDQIDRLFPSVHVKRLFVSGKLTSSNSNELQKMC